jgi:hypothetical protein
MDAHGYLQFLQYGSIWDKLSSLTRDTSMATNDAAGTTRTFPAGTFRRMGWAFLFLGISVGPSIRLGNENFLIDLLPDFIGYLMIATAANRLIPFDPRARGIRALALLLTYLAIPTVNCNFDRTGLPDPVIINHNSRAEGGIIVAV